ncbi:Geminivirus Rep catalytic domain [Carpediemonas membranifera]|uniref:ATP-dependent helicase Rep n=1 Tax=Carpediemonas membranifera TaxID=201153 RepID=A0A8J6B2W6_9EUKA|nr:Geminivirus Rep catalytic domain [Carpediemonas membranifera]|eukprot:KAG9391817.1 Geminivirus Rep catalytic domain [Carpediemonas membranifera]
MVITMAQRAKTFFLTYPKWTGSKLETDDDFNRLKATMDTLISTSFKHRKIHECVIAKENHKNEGIHLHMLIVLDDRTYWNAKKHPDAWDVEDHHPHVEVARGLTAVRRYCKKDGCFRAWNCSPITTGRHSKEINTDVLHLDPVEALRTKQVSFVDFRAFLYAHNFLKLHTQVNEVLDTPRGIWIWGPPGTGKSWAARNNYGASDLYLKAQNKWWDGYSGEKTAIIDDLDTDCLNHYLKIHTVQGSGISLIG